MGIVTLPFGPMEVSLGIAATALLRALSLHAGRGMVDGLPLRLDVAMTIIITGVVVFGVVVYDMYRRYTRVVE